jgi:hypothetical protein
MGSYNWYFENTYLGRDEDGNALYSPTKWVNYAPNSWWPGMATPMVPEQPSRKIQHVWTGNDATDPTCEFDAVECPGGWKYDNYKFVTVNSLHFKYATPMKASAKKSGAALTINVSLDRFSINQNCDSSCNLVHNYNDDVVKVYRDGKLIKSASLYKTGRAKLTVADKKGIQRYTVCVPQTPRSWGKCETFRK